jgi:putative ABC transport system substrate-binding protein
VASTTHRLPLVSVFKEWADAGALMSYGPNLPELWRYVDKILKGAKPADLPVEEPTTALIRSSPPSIKS